MPRPHLCCIASPPHLCRISATSLPHLCCIFCYIAGLEVRRRLGEEGGEAADRLCPSERVQVVLDAPDAHPVNRSMSQRTAAPKRVRVVVGAHHRRRVDRLSLEDATVERAVALAQPEDLGQRARRLVRLEPRDGARPTGGVSRTCRGRVLDMTAAARRREARG